MINYAIGTGVLALPRAIAAASLWVAIPLLILVMFSSLLQSLYAVDAIRLNFLLERSGVINIKMTEYDAITVPEESESKATDPDILNDRVYQLSGLMERYFGPVGLYLFQVFIVIFFFALLWGYG